MADSKVVIRLGSHAEKEYLLKTAKFMDGLILGANLVEATPGATASLVIKVSGGKAGTPYYVDPMTYAFGTYRDRGTTTLRADLDWIKSDQKVPGKKGQTRRDFKSSYKALAEAFGGVFHQAIDKKRAIDPSQFESTQSIQATSAAVIKYQLTRLASELEGDPESADYAKDLPKPAAIFAPYFYIEPSDAAAWIAVNMKLASATAAAKPGVPVHAVVCADVSYLSDAAFLAEIKKSLPATGVDAVWLWFSRFQEDEASQADLLAFRDLTTALSKSMAVFNMHGGFFSLALAEFGLAGTSHGIGYGEQKDVLPIIGQSIPTVRYYLPAIHKRVGVPQIERCFDALGITEPKDFHEQVCACIVCKGVVSEKLADFGAFGEMKSRAQAKRPAQTPAAAKRCRFHFLLNRLSERNEQKQMTLQATRAQLAGALEKWGSQPTLEPQTRHLEKWIAVLTPPKT